MACQMEDPVLDGEAADMHLQAQPADALQRYSQKLWIEAS
jgi:hypothetical protein